jgi:hypothetical protein
VNRRRDGAPATSYSCNRLSVSNSDILIALAVSYYFSHLEQAEGKGYLRGVSTGCCSSRGNYRRRGSIVTDKILKMGAVAGVLLAFAGLLAIPGALNSETRDQELLGTALAFFGMGALIIALSLYFQARALQARINADPNLLAALNATKRKGTCDSCKSAAPLIHCTMHRVYLCGTCLVQHYETRGCVYVPAVRKTARSTRTMAAGRV